LSLNSAFLCRNSAKRGGEDTAPRSSPAKKKKKGGTKKAEPGARISLLDLGEKKKKKRRGKISNLKLSSGEEKEKDEIAVKGPLIGRDKEGKSVYASEGGRKK